MHNHSMELNFGLDNLTIDLCYDMILVTDMDQWKENCLKKQI